MNCVSDEHQPRPGSEGPPTVSFQYFLLTGSMGTSSNSPSMQSINGDVLTSDEECRGIKVSGTRTRDG